MGSATGRWWDDFRSWAIPSNFNPWDHWGEGNTWEHKSYPKDCTAFEKPCHVLFGERWRSDGIRFYPQGVNLEQVLDALVDQENAGLAITIEGDGLDLLFPRMLAAHWQFNNQRILDAPKLEQEHRETLWPTLPYLGSSPKDSQLGGFAATLWDPHRSPGVWPQKRLKALRRRKHKAFVPIKGFNFRLGLNIGDRLRSGSPPILFGKHGTILGETFRGRRVYDYVDANEPALVVLSRACGHWEFYLELADRSAALVASPLWAPTNETRYDSTKRLIRTKVMSAGGALPDGLPLHDLAFDRVPTTLDSSIYFWCVHARMSIPFPSVGNEAISFSTVGKDAHWIRQNQLPPAGSRCELILNLHHGTIHSVDVASGAHFERTMEAYNILWLPLRISELDGRPDLSDAIRNLLFTGDVSDAEPLASMQLQRRDAYTTLPSRLLQYNADHPDRAKRYVAKNSRVIHRCSYCFK